MKRKILTGTSGWMYKHWNGTFYPQGLKENQLVFYSREFKTVELNYSFYRMPGAKAFAGWYEHTPEEFRFAIKMNRYITHLKRLIIDEESSGSLQRFLNDTQELKETLSVMLIQLHPGHPYDLPRLENFLEAYTEIVAGLKYPPKTCLEFRNSGWLRDETYKLMQRFGIALVFPNTELKRLVFPAGFAYIRIHGFNSLSFEDLKYMKNEIDGYPVTVKEVYVYFNNDWNTYAIYNARDFVKLL
jgi:uncharacterized protein YecE (DUF72 family)